VDKKRSGQILGAGMKAAKGRLLCYPQGGDYPRDFGKLYSWLEDKLFNLYESIQLRKTQHTYDMAGEIIITAAEIAEFAGIEIRLEQIEKKPKGVRKDGRNK